MIVNMGSFSGVSVASPMLSTYAGTKSFLASFTGSLAEEVRGKGIDVECVNTYFVVRTLSPSFRIDLASDVSLSSIPLGLQHVQDPPLERAHPHAQSLRPQRPL